MDTWFKSKAEELAQAAQQQIGELQQKASKLSQDVLQDIEGENLSGNKDISFGDGPFGFHLEGTIVVSVQDGSQAAAGGVEIGDRLLDIAGYDVPTCKPGDLDGEERVNKLIKKWLKEMPRPGRLTFAVPRPSGSTFEPSGAEVDASGSIAPGSIADAGIDSVQEHADIGDNVCSRETALANPSAIGTVVGEQLLISQGIAVPADIASDASCSGIQDEDSQRLVAELQEAKRSITQLRCTLDIERRKSATILEELGTARSRNKELLLAATSREADNDSTIEAADSRQRNLEQEAQRLRQSLADADVSKDRERGLNAQLTRLRGDLEAAHGSATAAQEQLASARTECARLTNDLEGMTTRSNAAEARATAVEKQVDVLNRELQGFRNAHDAELELLGEEQSGHVELQRRQLDEYKRHAEAELEDMRQKLDDALSLVTKHQATADAAADQLQAAAVEATAYRRAEIEAREEASVAQASLAQAIADAKRSSQGDENVDEADCEEPPEILAPKGSPEEVSQLHERIEVLERRCVALQKKLDSRLLTTTGHAGVGQSHPVWLPWITRVAGARTGAVAVLAYHVPEKALQSFTQRLLRHNTWLWIFYAHLLVLYVIAGSCSGAFMDPDAGSPIDKLNAKLKHSP